MLKKENRPILIVEDSPECFEITQRAFKKVGLANPIYHCEDGDTAMDYLFRRGKYSDPAQSPTPGIILLDLNLPGTDGHEILGMVKMEKNLKKIPVIVLTTSNDDYDIEKCYDNGANSYLQKPASFPGYIDVITRLKDYWFEVVVFPNG